MIDINLHPTARMLRQFAAAWLVVVTALGVNQWLLRGNPAVGAALVGAGVALGVVGLLRPAAVRWLFVVCTVAAFPVGWIVSQVMLLVLFLSMITPIALLFKAMGRDRLLRRRPQQGSYWKRKMATEDVRRYLRQY